jgi:microcystin-dependent protein
MSADDTDSIFEASSTRNFTVKTNTATRLTINSTAATTTVPVVLPADPTTALQATTKQYVDLIGNPAGIIAPFAGTVVPSGWLACQGQAVSQTTYAALFAAIGTTWNTTGEGAGNFRLPDLRGMFVRGTGTNATGSSSGAVGPSVGAYAADTYLNHSHTATSTDAGHIHSIGSTNPNGAGGGGLSGFGSSTTFNTNTGTANITTTVATSTTGGTETKPKNYGVLYIIKT